MRKLICLSVVAAFVTSGASATPSKQSLKGASLLSMAKVSVAAARTRALAARPGVITDQELEKEKGGTGLRYSFDIKSNGKAFEVGVDARTGKVLENSVEGSNAD